MRIGTKSGVFVVSSILFLLPAAAPGGEVYTRALAALAEGRTGEAALLARQLIALDASNPDFHSLLGEVYVRDGRLMDALRELDRASVLRGEPDPVALKRLATVGEWVRVYGRAEGWLQGALDAAPGDAEARGALNDLRLRRSLHIMGSAGGNEVDYVTRAREAGAFAGWLDWLDVYGGYSTVEKPFYSRSTVSADAYFFPDYRFTLRAGFRLNRYSYPLALTSPPDAGAYGTVPEYQLEAGYRDTPHGAVALELEYFRPSFYASPLSHADNMKATLSASRPVVGPFYARAFVAVLRDPDGGSFTTAPGVAPAFRYETVSLAGGAVGAESGPFAGEVQYVPDRDLDRSIRWSLFARLSWDFGGPRLQYDMVYDRYEADASRGFSASRVNMLTCIVSPLQALELRPGVKVLSRDVTSLVPFVSVRLRTGL